MWLGIFFNVLLLLGFKYLSALLNFLDLTPWSNPALFNSGWMLTDIIAPLGISFFCFESIAYLVDVYRGSPATTRFIEFGAYKLFFP